MRSRAPSGQTSRSDDAAASDVAVPGSEQPASSTSISSASSSSTFRSSASLVKDDDEEEKEEVFDEEEQRRRSSHGRTIDAEVAAYCLISVVVVVTGEARWSTRRPDDATRQSMMSAIRNDVTPLALPSLR